VLDSQLLKGIIPDNLPNLAQRCAVYTDSVRDQPPVCVPMLS
jgi:hypothetical protein